MLAASAVSLACAYFGAYFGSDAVRTVVDAIVGPSAAFAVGGTLVVTAILATAWFIFTVWKTARPREVAAKPVPTALKGAGGFGKADGALFQKLGRGEELSRLLDVVLNKRYPLFVVHGESGSGKTSLLRAGLAYALERNYQGQVCYVEVRPRQPAEQILEAANREFGAAAASLEGLRSMAVEGPTAVVLDQFEQLDPADPAHRPVFDFLRGVLGRSDAYATVWIVAFRRDYQPDWLDFLGPENVGRFHYLAVKLFSRRDAEDVVKQLAAATDLRLSEELVSSLVRSFSSEAGGVSPSDIGISMLALHQLARGRDSGETLTADDYRAVGLLTRYIEEKLEAYPADRDGILKAMLALADDKRPDRRLAEGRSATELARRSGMAEHRLKGYLRGLASRDVRLLEETDGAFRLVHERLIPPLRGLAGAILAEEDRARMLLEDAVRDWSRTGSSRSLLRGGDLRLVEAHEERCLAGDLRDSGSDLLRRARAKHRSKRWLAAGVSSIAVLLVAVSGYWTYENNRQTRYQEMLRSWGAPAALYEQRHQFTRVSVSRLSMPDCGWLGRNVEELELNGLPVSFEECLPEGLQRLSLDWSEGGAVPDLGEKLPEGLTQLSLDWSGRAAVPDLGEKLPEGLTQLSLDWSGRAAVPDLGEKLPEGLTQLSLSGLRPDNAPTYSDELPSTLRSIELKR